MWRLVQDSTLDSNSPYAYLMLARYFAETCVLAERDGELGGFVSAFIPPEQPDALFVWQVGVGPLARGRGLATQLVAAALARKVDEGVRFVEATVTPSNSASLALFRGIAAKLGTRCKEAPCFAADLFPGNGHEEELLLRIGPFDPSDLSRLTPNPE